MAARHLQQSLAAQGLVVHPAQQPMRCCHVCAAVLDRLQVVTCPACFAIHSNTDHAQPCPQLLTCLLCPHSVLHYKLMALTTVSYACWAATQAAACCRAGPALPAGTAPLRARWWWPLTPCLWVTWWGATCLCPMSTPGAAATASASQLPTPSRQQPMPSLPAAMSSLLLPPPLLLPLPLLLPPSPQLPWQRPPSPLLRLAPGASCCACCRTKGLQGYYTQPWGGGRWREWPVPLLVLLAPW